MMSQFSNKFLARISEYPIAVQEALCSETSRELVMSATAVFHGKALTNEEKILDAIEKFPIFDSLLGNLVASKKFQSQFKSAVSDLESGDGMRADRAISGLIRDLSDENSPYFYKLLEVAKLEEFSFLSIVFPLIDFYRSVELGKGDTETVLSQMIASGRSPFLSGLAHSYGIDGLQILGGEFPSFLTGVATRSFAKGFSSSQRLSDPSSSTKADLSRLAVFLGELTNSDSILPNAEPFGVLLPSDASDDCLSWWVAHLESGLICDVSKDEEDAKSWERKLTLSSLARPSPIMIAALSRVDLSGNLTVEIAGQINDSTNWASQVVGYPEPIMQLVSLGEFQGAGDESPATKVRLVWGLDLEDTEAQIGSTTVSLDDSFAVLVRMDDGCDAASYLNNSSCLVVNGLQGLASLLKDCEKSVHLQKKPTLFLSRCTPAEPDYVISAVQAFWRYGGQFTTAGALVTIKADNTGNQKLDTDSDIGLGHVAPLGLTCMSVQRAMKISEGFLNTDVDIVGDLYIQKDELILRKNNWSNAQLADFVPRIERVLNDLPLTDFERDEAFLWALQDTALADSFVSLKQRSALPREITMKLREFQGLRRKLKQVIMRPELKSVGELIVLIAKSDRSVLTSSDFDQFADAVTRDVSLIRKLSDNQIFDFFALLKQSSAIDIAARNLATFAQEICQHSSALIIDLFSVLAMGLPEDELNIVIAECSAVTQGRARTFYRLAEVQSRYGSPRTLLHYLKRILATHPDLAKEDGFLKAFSSLLVSYDRNYLNQVVGTSVVKRIHKSIKFENAFRQAVRMQNKTDVQNLLERDGDVGSVNLVHLSNGLRAFSNELRSLEVKVNDFQHTDTYNQHVRQILAATLFDIDTLSELKAHDLLFRGTDLDIICNNILGDNQPLNDYLSEMFSETNIPSLKVLGSSVSEVFENAAIETKSARKTRISKSSPLVTVVISAFDPDIDLLRKSIASMVNQTHTKVEIIVVDDRSQADFSRAINAVVDEFDDTVRVIQMVENSGPYVGRNRVIQEAKGEFIAIQDADDWSHPNRLELQLNAFKESPLLKLVTAPHIRIDHGGFIQMEAGFSILGDGPMTSLFRKSVFDDIGMFASVRSRGDVEMRERIRSYFGPHALLELETPMMLCLAASQTLSQQTNAKKSEQLQMFRTNISQRRELRLLRRRDEVLTSSDAIQIPFALRPPKLKESNLASETLNGSKEN